ncbi:hypothetical protein ABW21_db0209897 [Orbilia brochopaga]|nr:hypothetical protein ABW21_db0209897 [Drechslerella brochopaga]
MASTGPSKIPSPGTGGVRDIIKKLPGTSMANDPLTPQDAKSEAVAAVSNVHAIPPSAPTTQSKPMAPVADDTGTRNPAKRRADPSSRRSIYRHYNAIRMAARALPPRRPRSECWGQGLFQCQEHVAVVNKISEIFDLQGEESLWQPQDPLHVRKVVNSIMEKFIFHVTVEIEDEKEKDTMMVVAAAVFMRLGCRLPSQMKEYTDKLSKYPPVPTITISSRSIQQITQALEIYRSGNFYIFETAPLEMMPLLASSQNWERDLWGRDLDEVIEAANGNFSSSYRAVQGVDCSSRAAASLSCIQQILGTNHNVYNEGEPDDDDELYDDFEFDFDDDDDDSDGDGVEYDDDGSDLESNDQHNTTNDRKKKDDNDKETAKQMKTDPTPAQVSVGAVQPSELVRRPSTKAGETATMSLERIANSANPSRKSSLRDPNRHAENRNSIDTTRTMSTSNTGGGTGNHRGRGLVKGFKNMFVSGGKKKNGRGSTHD